MKTSPTMGKNKSKAQAQTRTDAVTEVSKVSVYAIAISAGLIGLWATVCLFAGTLSSGGPFGLVSNLIKAIIG